MSDIDREDLFEIYKLHSELAQRIDEVREGLNKAYSSMVISIVAASILFYRLFPSVDYISLLPLLGALLSLSWAFSFHSVTKKLTAKHIVLLEIECKLPFQFFKRENNHYKSQKFLRRKYTGQILPAGFFLVSILMLFYFCVFDHSASTEKQETAVLCTNVCVETISNFIVSNSLSIRSLLFGR